jgi:hypothetical protein
MKATIVGRLNLPEPSATVLIHGADLWIYGHQSRELRRFSGHREGSLRAAAPLQVQTPAKHGVSLSWDGANVLVADQVTRTVCRVDPNSGQQALVMDPQSLRGDNDRRHRLARRHSLCVRSGWLFECHLWH